MTFRYLVLIAVALWATAGCESIRNDAGKDLVLNDPPIDVVTAKPALEVPLPNALVEVQPYDPVHLRPQDHYDIGLSVTYADGLPRERMLRLEKSDGPEGTSVSVTLFDESNEMLVSVTQRWWMEENGTAHSIMNEHTAADELIATISVNGDTVTESYEINDQPAEFAYVRGTASEDDAGTAFAHFYDAAPWTSARTLDNNAEGSMMMLLVNDASFGSWAVSSLVPAYERGPMTKPACDIRCICSIAGICAGIKCGTGPANLACDVCAGVALGCAVADLVIYLTER